MLQIDDSTGVVKVTAQARGQNTKYSTTVQGKEIVSVIEGGKPSYIMMLAFYMTTKKSVVEKLTNLELDAVTIAQEVQVSINMQASLEQSKQ